MSTFTRSRRDARFSKQQLARRWVRGLMVALAIISTTAANYTLPGTAAIPAEAAGDPSMFSSRAVSWETLPGRATDIAVGARGDVWMVGGKSVPGGFGVFRWTGKEWSSAPGGAGVRIAVDPDGRPWTIRQDGSIFVLGDGGWFQIPGLAKDIAVDDDGLVYRVGVERTPGGFIVERYIPEFHGWTTLERGATRIAAGKRVWVVNDAGRVFRYGADGWVALPSRAVDVGAGGADAWIVGTERVTDGQALARFNGVRWEQVEVGGAAVAVDGKGDPWVVTESGTVLHGTVTIRMRACPVEEVVVPEDRRLVIASRLRPGEEVTVNPGGSKIWAGVVATGWNGPRGWDSAAPNWFPLPGAPAFGLLVSIGSGWRHLGASTISVQNHTGEYRPLLFRVNDNVPGNGKGEFRVSLTFTCRTFLRAP